MISTEDALWEAVGANPADSLPRLVLADWCDERGQPDTAAGLRATADRVPLEPISGIGSGEWSWYRRVRWHWIKPRPADIPDDVFDQLPLVSGNYSFHPTARAAIADLVAAWVKVNTTCPQCDGRGKTHRPYPGGWDECESCHGTGKVAPG